MRKTLSLVLTLLLVSALLCGCAQKIPEPKYASTKLSSSVVAQKVTANEVDKKFVSAVDDFSFDLWATAFEEGKNNVLSPMSVFLALAMTANGACENTLAQFEELFSLDVDTLNKYAKGFSSSLYSQGKVKCEIANSVWFDKKYDIETNFLQNVADFYGSEIFGTDFSAAQTVCDDINAWINYHTDGNIEKMLDKVSPEAFMFLINTIVFDAKWAQNVTEAAQMNFTANGETKTVDFLKGEEAIYFADDNTTGFAKNYAEGGYKFLAFLPDEDVDINDYAKAFTSGKFQNLISTKSNEQVNSAFPLFDFRQKQTLNDTLKAMGLEDAFDADIANFNKIYIPKENDDFYNLYIETVLHEAYVKVGLEGTKAGAATVVEIDKATSVGPDEHQPKNVICDRPFLFVIVDTNYVPLFVGIVATV